MLWEGICKEAFEEHEDNCCVPRQIAAVLKFECADVCRDMDAVERRLYPDAPASWHEVGCTPRMVLEYCRGQSGPLRPEGGSRGHGGEGGLGHRSDALRTGLGGRPVRCRRGDAMI